MAGDHALAKEDGSHRSLLGDPCPSNGGDIFFENAR